MSRYQGAKVPKCRGLKVSKCQGLKGPMCIAAKVPRCREVPRCKGADPTASHGVSTYAEVPTESKKQNDEQPHTA